MVKVVLSKLYRAPIKTEDEIPYIYRRYNYVYWMTIIFVPIWGLMYNYLLPNIKDPIINRILSSLLPLASLYFSRKFNFSYSKRYALFMFNLIVLNTHLLWITSTTGNHPMYVLGSYLTFSACGMFLDNEKSLLLFILSMILPLSVFNGTVINSSIPVFFIYFLFASGAIINYFGLTDRFELIKKLRQLNIEIKEKSAEIAKERMNSFNASKLASLGDMASNIAHEINNPLTIIQGYVRKIKRSMLENNNELLSEDVHFQLDQIIITTERIALTITRLKKLSPTRSNFEMTMVNPIYLTETITDYFVNRFFVEKIKFRCEINYEELKNTAIYCRQDDISQILINLINNAIFAAKENINKAPEVAITCNCDNEFVYFSIEDSGSGISNDILEKIYEPFFTTKQAINAVGLGLSITKTVVEDNLGVINLDRNVNFTRFVIKFQKSNI